MSPVKLAPSTMFLPLLIVLLPAQKPAYKSPSKLLPLPVSFWWWPWKCTVPVSCFREHDWPKAPAAKDPFWGHLCVCTEPILPTGHSVNEHAQPISASCGAPQKAALAWNLPHQYCRNFLRPLPSLRFSSPALPFLFSIEIGPSLWSEGSPHL